MNKFVETNPQVSDHINHNNLAMKVAFDGNHKNELFLANEPSIDACPQLVALESAGKLLNFQGTAELKEGKKLQRTGRSGVPR